MKCFIYEIANSWSVSLESSLKADEDIVVILDVGILLICEVLGFAASIEGVIMVHLSYVVSLVFCELFLFSLRCLLLGIIVDQFLVLLNSHFTIVHLVVLHYHLLLDHVMLSFEEFKELPKVCCERIELRALFDVELLVQELVFLEHVLRHHHSALG